MNKKKMPNVTHYAYNNVSWAATRWLTKSLLPNVKIMHFCFLSEIYQDHTVRFWLKLHKCEPLWEKVSESVPYFNIALFQQSILLYPHASNILLCSPKITLLYVNYILHTTVSIGLYPQNLLVCTHSIYCSVPTVWLSILYCILLYLFY